MHSTLASDLANFDALLERTRRHAVAALASLDDRPAALAPPPATLRALPEEGAGLAGALEEFVARWSAGFSGSAGPRYLGFVTGGATPASLAGDWLTGVYDQNPTAGIDSAAPDLERETIARLRELFGLSEAQQGVFVTGATMSNLVGLALGREWLGERNGVNVSEQGVGALGAVRVLAATPHSSVYKALSVLGIGRQAVRKVPTLAGREAIDLVALEAALAESEGVPVIVVASAGTVNTVDFDDLQAIHALKARYPFWLHVDAAFGAFAALAPAYAPLVAGLDAADSICIDLHKWLNVPYDAAVQFTRRRDLQVRVFQNSAAYLGIPTDNPDFVHLTPENSRRLRALATWFSLAAYGRAGHAEIVARNIALAQALGARLEGQRGFRLLAPTRLNVVCFTLAANADEARINAYVRAVRDLGEVFITSTVYAGTWGLRVAFTNWRTGEADVARIFDSLCKALDAVEASGR
ncbi:pyridoxal phosphate-dependent decarboxylase family protein [Paraburkholderia sp. DD10]|uniref:Glutamate or tyrosine decarboxylase n=1 Tax=Paraburkholderia terricola TaxID=169427 RepID=A0A1M6K850_9BURK|nr:MULTISPECIES: pyridoxal-dependent decarboxylase [Paraburkholderia]SDN71982.1 Glutamate or tyrosine decarboxylase [Paraburkholderia sediminicola]SHJ55161.1 Glutamate or tyrosine decarboxylase [Paraburkholderia terricola]